MNIYSIRFSPTAGTAAIADCLCAAFDQKAVTVDLCSRTGNFSAVSINPDDLCIISVPSFGGRIPTLAAARIGQISGNGARAVAVCTYGNRAYDDTLLEMKHLLTAQGFRCVAAVAAVTSHSMFRPTACAELLCTRSAPQYILSHANFLIRPDDADRAVLSEFARKIARAVKEGTYCEDLKVPGNFPYRPIGAFVQPEASERCDGCGACAAMCPAGAIPADNPSLTDKTLCASCMRCTLICPRRARGLRPEVMQAVMERLFPLLEGRRENELFL